MAKPLRPYKITVTPVSSTEIELTWVKQNDASITHFHIYESEGSSDKFTKLPQEPDANTTSLLLTGRKPATRYSYYVVSVTGTNEESDTWTAKSCTTPGDTADTYLQGVKQVAEKTTFTFDYPIERCDVVVVGAGYSGLSAAYGAALEGKKVILLERTQHVGGMGIGANVTTYMYTTAYAKPFQDWYDRYIQFGHYFIATWSGIWGEKGLKKSLNESGGNYEPALAEITWHEMLRDVGVSLRLDHMGTQAIIERKAGARDKIVGVIVETPVGRYAILAKVVIDCTYHLTIAYDAGAEYMLGRESRTQRVVRKKGAANIYEPHSESVIVGGVEYVPDTPDEIIQTYSSHLGFTKTTSAVTAKRPPSGIIYTQDSDLPQGGWGTLQHITPDILAQNVLRVVGLPENDGAMQFALQKHWKQAGGYQYLFNSAHEQYYVFNLMPMLLGIRESRRILGDYVLTANDLANGAFTWNGISDSIARGNYVIDIHGNTGDGSAGTLLYPDPPLRNGLNMVNSYGIPYRCLYSRNIDNLLCPSARNLSASHYAMAGTRVQIQCMATGFAGGLAAAQAINNNQLVRDIDVNVLRNRLTYYGQPIS